ncbi:MAG TPA: TatD family hydrolase [Candidatus Omnitrophota bacterium]|nr:TatD family hydrolase [Candidatus Omnitrophota bacterium]HNQ50554.1 TatD family hydrolase [Candidatus Omnitrophota bacterium]
MPLQTDVELIDTHAHIDFHDYDADRGEVIRRAEAQGVRRIINIGSSLEGSVNSVDLAKKYPNVYAVVGCHPHDARDFSDSDLAQVRSLAAADKVVAIGEIGLDYYRNLSPQDSQQRLFVSFIRMAQDLDLPVVIHTRQAAEDTLRIVREEKLERAVVHCFSGDERFMRDCLDMGFYISFTCNITYKRSQGLRDLAAIVPLDRLFLETDAPYLSPEGSRGKRNEPASVRLLAETVAGLRNVPFEDICRATTQNAVRFFSLDV